MAKTSSLVRKYQLLEQLLENGRNARQHDSLPSPCEVQMILRMVKNKPKATWGETVNDLKRARTTVTKATCKILYHRRVKSCKAHLKFVSDPLQQGSPNGGPGSKFGSKGISYFLLYLIFTAIFIVKETQTIDNIIIVIKK